MKLLMTLVITIILTSASNFSFSQAVHSWTDENGVVHFSQMPPEDQEKASQVNLRTAPSPGSAVDYTPSTVEEETEQASDSEASAPATYEKNAAACTQAKDMLATLNTGVRLRITDPETGEIKYASDEDRAEQRRRANSTIERDC